jgi:hypothetical protein
MPTVKKDALAEKIAKKLSGFAGVPPAEQERMIRAAAKVCTDYLAESIGGAVTEIRAGSVLSPKNDADVAWNGANDRSIRILERYKTGEGLFQI